MEKLKLNDIADDLLIINKYTIENLLKIDDGGSSLVLYIFYYKTAKWQKTNTIKANDTYVAKYLKWGKSKITKTKELLKKRGLIKIIQRRKNGKISGWYIELEYIVSKNKIEKMQVESNNHQEQEVESNNHQEQEVAKTRDCFQDTNALKEQINASKIQINALKEQIDTLKEQLSASKEQKNKSKHQLNENISKIINIFNTNCTNLPKVIKLTEKRKTAINKLLKEITEEQFRDVCVIANNSDFLIGNNKNGWKADFDFLLRPDKAVSVLEGKYNNKKRDKIDDFVDLWEEAKKEDEKNGNFTDNNTTSW